MGQLHKIDLERHLPFVKREIEEQVTTGMMDKGLQVLDMVHRVCKYIKQPGNEPFDEVWLELTGDKSRAPNTYLGDALYSLLLAGRERKLGWKMNELEKLDQTYGWKMISIRQLSECIPALFQANPPAAKRIDARMWVLCTKQNVDNMIAKRKTTGRAVDSAETAEVAKLVQRFDGKRASSTGDKII